MLKCRLVFLSFSLIFIIGLSGTDVLSGATTSTSSTTTVVSTASTTQTTVAASHSDSESSEHANYEPLLSEIKNQLMKGMAILAVFLFVLCILTIFVINSTVQHAAENLLKELGNINQNITQASANALKELGNVSKKNERLTNLLETGGKQAADVLMDKFNTLVTKIDRQKESTDNLQAIFEIKSRELSLTTENKGDLSAKSEDLVSYPDRETDQTKELPQLPVVSAGITSDPFLENSKAAYKELIETRKPFTGQLYLTISSRDSLANRISLKISQTPFQSPFIIFCDNSAQNGWIFPNPLRTYTESMKQIFPELTSGSFDQQKISLKPVEARKIASGEWEVKL